MPTIVSVLGRPVVRVGDRSVRPVRRMARVLLGMLALRANRPLPHEALLDSLWPDRAPASVQELVAHTVDDRVFGEIREVAFTPWGGAYARVPRDATAFAHRDAAYLVKHTVLVGPNGAARRGAEALAWLAGSWAVVHPWGNGGAYVNFSDPDLPDHLTAYHGPHLPALRAVKAKYDPDNVFRFAQSIR